MEEEEETNMETGCTVEEDWQSSGDDESGDEEEGQSEEESDEEEEDDDDEEEEDDGESEGSGEEEEQDDEDESGEADGEEDEDSQQDGLQEEGGRLDTPPEDSCKPSTSHTDNNSEECLICLNTMQGIEVASPESCDHRFCLECLLEWSRMNNSCPLDRILFNIILVYRPGKDKVFKRISVEDARMREDDGYLGAEQVDDVTVCEVCGQSDREDTLLLCDGCDHGYHCECLTPPLATVPVEEWFCPNCQEYQADVESAEEEEHEVVDLTEEVTLPRRHIPRTRATERVRQRIQIHRLQQRRPLELQSSDEDELEVSGDAAGAVIATTSTSRSWSTSHTGTTSRVTIRRTTTIRKKTTRKRRKTTRRKKTTKGRKTKSATSGTTKKTTRKKGRKRKTKRKKKTTAKSRRSATSRAPSSSRFSATSQAFCAPISRTIKGRIADRLGLSKPPPGRTIPMQRKVTEKASDFRRHDMSSAPLSILGDRDELIAFQDVREDNNAPYILPAARDASTVVLPRRFDVSRQSVKKPIPESLIQTSSSPSFDIMNVIMDQAKLHMDSADIVIKRDGSLETTKPVKARTVDKPLTAESKVLTFSEMLKRDFSLKKPNADSASPSDTAEPGAGEEGSADNDSAGKTESGNEHSSADQGNDGESAGSEHMDAEGSGDVGASGTSDLGESGRGGSPLGSGDTSVTDTGNEESKSAGDPKDPDNEQDKKSSSPGAALDEGDNKTGENPEHMGPNKRKLEEEESQPTPAEPQRPTRKRVRKSRWSDITEVDQVGHIKQEGAVGIAQQETDTMKSYGKDEETVSDVKKEAFVAGGVVAEDRSKDVGKEDKTERNKQDEDASFPLSSFLSNISSEITQEVPTAAQNQDKTDDPELAFVNGACVRISRNSADTQKSDDHFTNQDSKNGEKDGLQSTCGPNDRSEEADGRTRSPGSVETHKLHDKGMSPSKITDYDRSQYLSRSGSSPPMPSLEKETDLPDPKEDRVTKRESESGSDRGRGRDNRDRYGRDRDSPESDTDRYGRKRRDYDRDRGDRRDKGDRRNRDRGDHRYRDRDWDDVRDRRGRGRDRDNQKDRRGYGRNWDDKDREDRWRSRSPRRDSKRRWEEEENDRFTKAGWRNSDSDRSRRGQGRDVDVRGGMNRNRDRDVRPEAVPQDGGEDSSLTVTQPVLNFEEQNVEEQHKEVADEPERKPFGQWSTQDQNSGAADTPASFFNPHNQFQQMPPPVPAPLSFRPPLFNQPPPFLDPYSVPAVPPPPPLSSLRPPLSLPLPAPGGFRPWLRPILQQQEQQQQQPPPPPPPPIPPVRPVGNLSQPPPPLPKNLNLLSIQHLEMLRKSLLMVTSGSNSNTPTSGSPVTVGQEQGAHPVGQPSQLALLPSAEIPREENGYVIDDEGEPMDLDDPDSEPEQELEVEPKPEPRPMSSKNKDDSKEFQNQVIEEVRKAIRPYFNTRQISKAEYKEILKKCVPKVTKSGQIHEKKVGNLVAAYVKKYRATRPK